MDIEKNFSSEEAPYAEAKYLLIYLYIYIDTNVSAKAFISITFQNQMEHTYR